MAKGRRAPRGAQGIMAQLEKMEAELERAQQELAEETVEVTAGGGAVRVVMSGTQQCRQVEISPELLQAGDHEMVQDLIQLAVNQAIHESQVLAARRLGPLSSMASAAGLGG